MLLCGSEMMSFCITLRRHVWSSVITLRRLIRFVRCMMEGQIGRMLGATGDGVSWDDPNINREEINEMMSEL